MKGILPYLILLPLLISGTGIFGQNKGGFVLLGKVVENETLPIEGVTITVIEDEEKKSEATTTKKGRYELNLEMNKDYTIEFSKAGYVSKRISVSTEPTSKCKVKNWETDIGPSVSLFKFLSGVNYSMFKNPVAYYEFTDKCDFEMDENYAKTVSAMQNKVRDDVTKVQKEVAKTDDKAEKLKQEQEKQKQADDKYKQMIAFADEEFSDKNYENAQKIYTEALTLKPNQIYPETQLIRIRGLLADKQKELEKQKQAEALANKKPENNEPKKEEVKEVVKPTAESLASGNEDKKKAEKKTEALLQMISDENAAKETSAQLEKQIEIDRANDFKSILAHTNAKRIFLEEIADSKMRMKMAKGTGKINN